MSDPRLDDTQNVTGTQPMRPVNPRRTARSSGTPPTPRSPMREVPGKRKRDEPRSSPFYLPAWSVGLMLLMVFGIAAGIVTLVMMLGGQTKPGGEPRVIIVTAIPTATSDQPPTQPVNPESLQNPAGTTDLPLPTFALEGPTLPPIIFTPTPLSISVGSAVIVNSEDGLNVRPAPGIDNTPLFNAPFGAGFNVIGGPQQAAGLTWWQIQDPADPTRQGWAAAVYLDVFSP